MESIKSIALFIDVDNLSIPLKEKNKRIDWDVILNIIKTKVDQDVRLYYARAYFNRRDDEKGESYCHSLFERGIEAVYSPVYSFKDKRKSLSDPMMICDIISTIYEMEYIKNFVIVTSDKDFIPVIRNLIKKDKEVIVIGIKENGFHLFTECEKLGIPFIDYPL